MRFSILLLIFATVQAHALGLLSRTGNMLVRSAEFENASWVLTRVNAWGATDTGAGGAGSFANTSRTTDPNGGNTADFLQEDNTASNSHFINQDLPAMPAGQYVFSVYAKAAGRSWIRPAIIFANHRLRVNFQLSGSGTVGTVVNEGDAVGATGTIQSVGNGWYLCTVRGKMPYKSDSNNGVFVALGTGDNVTTYSGDNTSGVYLFGASFRGSAWSPTYIPTGAYSVAAPYFVDPSGKAVLLTGGHVWPSSQSMAQVPADYTWENWSDLNVSTNWSYQRIWIFDELLMSHGAVNDLPFQRTGPGNAADGGLKINLSLYNQSFFNQLSNRVKRLDTNGIYASVMFFQGVRVNGNTAAWATNIWNTANNVNGVLSSRSDVYALNNATHWNLCTQYVAKVIDSLNGFSNVLWEVGNEMPRQSTNFQNSIIQFVRDYEAAKPLQHLIGMTSYDVQAWSTDVVNLNTNVIDVSLADWCSYTGVGDVPPNFNDAWKTNPPAANPIIVSILDTDHIWGANGTSTWVWRAFTRGHNPINQDTPGSGYADFAPDNTLRRQMGHIKRYADRVNMRTMMAAPAMASTGFCLTNAQLQYFGYQPAAANFTMKLPAGRYYYEKWRTDTAAGGVQEKGWVYQPTGGDFTWFHPGNEFFVFCESTRFAGGIEFDGVDDLVNCGSGSTLDDVSQVTVTAWIFPRTMGEANARIVAKENTSGSAETGIFILNDSGYSICWFRKFSGGLGIWKMPAGNFATNTWHHVAVTYNDASVANDPVLYLNGTSRTVTEFMTPSGTRSSDAAFNFTIGATEGGGQAFDGLIQDVRVYSRILNAAEIAALYNARSRDFQITSGLVGHWPLDDGPDGSSADTDVARDRAGKGNNGTGDDGANNTGLTWRSGGPLLK
jgi:hypothetical protein